MGRPNSMTELVKPNRAKGLKGKYRTKYNGIYRWYRANSKQEALTMFHADIAAQSHTFVPVRDVLTKQGQGGYAQAIEGWIRENPDSTLMRLTDWSDLPQYLHDHKDLTPEALAASYANHQQVAALAAKVPSQIVKAKTVHQAVELFLTRQRAKVGGGKISAGRYDILQRCVNHFAEFVGANSSIDRIDGAMLEAYNSCIMELIGEGWSPDYGDLYMSVARQFVRWAFTTDLLAQLPRNIDSQELAIVKPKKQVKFFDKDKEIRPLLAACTPRMKLNLLLMLNCGMTQKDVSDLHPSEVDWKKGTITRRRSKTRKEGDSVPTVTYPLWKETFALLQKFGRRDGDHVLLNADGKPLRVDELRLRDGEQQFTKIDNIAVGFRRLKAKLAKKKITITKSLKVFRSTSNSVLKNSKDFAHYAVHFLGQSPRGINEANYTAVFTKSFADAVNWLRTYYGIE